MASAPTQQASQSSMMRQLQDSRITNHHNNIKSHIVNNGRNISKMKTSSSQAPLPPPPPPPLQPPPSSHSLIDLKQAKVTSANNPAPPPPPPPPPMAPTGVLMVNNGIQQNKGSHSAIQVNGNPLPSLSRPNRSTPMQKNVSAPDINALLSQIQQGKKLRKTNIVKDASSPLVAGKIAGPSDATHNHSTCKLPTANGPMVPGNDLASQLKNKFNSMNAAKNVRQQKHLVSSTTETTSKGNLISIETHCDIVSSSPTKPPTPPKHGALATSATNTKSQPSNDILNTISDFSIQNSSVITQVNGASLVKSAQKNASDNLVNNTDSYQIIKASTTTVTTNQLLLAKARRDSIHSVSTSSTSSINHIGSDANTTNNRLALPMILSNQVSIPVTPTINRNRVGTLSSKSSSTIKTLAPLPPPRTQSCVRPSVGPPPPPVPSNPPVPPTRNSSMSKMTLSNINLTQVNSGSKFASKFELMFKPLSQIPKPEPFTDCQKIYPSQKVPNQKST